MSVLCCEGFDDKIVIEKKRPKGVGYFYKKQYYEFSFEEACKLIVHPSLRRKYKFESSIIEEVYSFLINWLESNSQKFVELGVPKTQLSELRILIRRIKYIGYYIRTSTPKIRRKPIYSGEALLTALIEIFKIKSYVKEKQKSNQLNPA